MRKLVYIASPLSGSVEEILCRPPDRLRWEEEPEQHPSPKMDALC